MPDLIRVVDLEVHAHLGVPEEERREPQRLLISFELVVESFAHAASTDNMSWTINYADVIQRVKTVVTKRRRKLLETVAEDIAGEVIRTFPIKRITLEVKKFILHDAQYVSVKIERRAPGGGIKGQIPVI